MQAVPINTTTHRRSPLKLPLWPCSTITPTTSPHDSTYSKRPPLAAQSHHSMYNTTYAPAHTSFAFVSSKRPLGNPICHPGVCVHAAAAAASRLSCLDLLTMLPRPCRHPTAPCPLPTPLQHQHAFHVPPRGGTNLQPGHQHTNSQPRCPHCSTRRLLQEQRRTNALMQTLLYLGLGFVASLLLLQVWQHFHIYFS